MNEILYDLLELLNCGVNGNKPSERLLNRYPVQADGVDATEKATTMQSLYQISQAHFVDALVGTVLRQAGVSLPGEWEQSIAKSIRKVILFDAERARLCDFMEHQGIWYLPLKGILLKEYYPSIGMRQMSDNDILFDAKYAEEIREHMISSGYRVESFGQGNHDVYEKEPVYNFEMHRALYGAANDNNWDAYYKDVKKRLVLNEGSSYAYHMTVEDAYIYIICHAYKHYKGSGTGIRSLLDFYVYLLRNEKQMDFNYIGQECEKLGIAVFEQQSRVLCKKVFGQQIEMDYAEGLQNSLQEPEWEMLQYYLTSGVYGTSRRLVENRMKEYAAEDGHVLRVRYLVHRLFPGREVYSFYPIVDRHRWLLPGLWVYRVVRMVFDRERREKIRQEVKIVQQAEDKNS